MNKISQKTIDKLRKHDEEAFNEIYEHYKNTIFFMALSHFKNQATAEDIVQEVFVELNKNIEKIETPQALTIWINKITYFKCMKQLKKSSRVMTMENTTEMIEDTSVDSDIVDVVNRKYINDIIKESILKMNYELKIVGLLRFYEQLSLQEISEVLNIPVGTVKSRLNTIKKKLREDLKSKEIHKSMSIIFLLPSHLKNIYAGFIEGAILKETLQISNIKTILIITIGSMLAMASAILIKNNNIEEYSTNIQISVNKEYTNKSLPIQIDTNEKYDYYLINGEKNRKIYENGEYKIELIRNDKTIYQKLLTINNIDREAPTLIQCVEQNKEVFIYVEDSQSGINEKGIECKSHNQSVQDFSYDINKNIIHLTISPNQKYQVYVPDKANNILKVDLSLREE